MSMVTRSKGQVMRTDPFVMRLMQPLVEDRMVFPAVDPVDTIVREQEEPTGTMNKWRRECRQDERTEVLITRSSPSHSPPHCHTTWNNP